MTVAQADLLPHHMEVTGLMPSWVTSSVVPLLSSKSSPSRPDGPDDHLSTSLTTMMPLHVGESYSVISETEL